MSGKPGLIVSESSADEDGGQDPSGSTRRRRAWPGTRWNLPAMRSIAVVNDAQCSRGGVRNLADQRGERW